MLKRYTKSLNRIIVFLFICFCITGCSSIAVHRNSVNEFKNIILIGWDGTQRDRLKEKLKEEKLPNLKRIIQEGSLIDVDVTTGDTSTKAGFAEILTGYSCRIASVYNNREKYKPIPRGVHNF